ncbi:MAG: nucleotidyl transferase AbiEii/AbiGii toxin family protein [Rectinemataceae bacterium]|nr:nucleotidyl transferase AbiEii/AbiGii toxin family protein [Rectinemataceae bacterium]
MMEIRTQDELMAALMAFIAEKFPQNAILKGGMSMRATFNCRRLTADIDLTFVPFKSKKPVFNMIEKALGTLDYARITRKGMRSTNAFFELALTSRPDITVIIEFSVEENCPAIPLSGASFAEKLNLPGFIMNVIDPSVAMANKMAAWLERDEMKDIYDIYFYAISGIRPDMDILKTRLSKINYQRKTTLPKKMDNGALLSLLLERVMNLTNKEIDSLSPILPADEIISLRQKLQAAINRLVFDLKK